MNCSPKHRPYAIGALIAQIGLMPFIVQIINMIQNYDPASGENLSQAFPAWVIMGAFLAATLGAIGAGFAHIVVKIKERNQPKPTEALLPENIIVGTPKAQVIAQYGVPDDEVGCSKTRAEYLGNASLNQSLKDPNCASVLIYTRQKDHYGVATSFVVIGKDETVLINVVHFH